MNYIVIEGPNGKREVPETDPEGNSSPFRLDPGERVTGSRQSGTVDDAIGLGDLLTAITTTTGFKQWWERQHGGPCPGCQQRAAAANYVQFKGPVWLKAWVAGLVKKE